MLDNMIKWADMHKKQLIAGIFIFIAVGFGVTRLWQLDRLPFGMHMDEAGMAYDAWCLANYGVDRWLKSWPVYMTNFYSGQSSLYAFLCAGLFRIFGYSIWMVRLPAVFFSLLTLVFGVMLAKQVYPKSVYLPILVGLMVTFCPYFIMSGRLALDCNLMLGMSTVFLYLFVTAVEKGEYWRYGLCGLAGGVLLYTYVLTYIMLPLFLVLALVYVIISKRFSFFRWLVMAIPLGVLATPLILVQVINLYGLPEMKIGIFTITKMAGYRAAEIGPYRFDNFVTAIRCIFIGDDYAFDSIPGIWNLYALTAVLFVIGFVNSLIKGVKGLKKREFNPQTVLLLWFLAILLFESHIQVNTYRLNGIFLVVTLIAVEAIYVLETLLKRRGKKWFPPILVCLCGVYAICMLRFGLFYYSGRYTEATYPMTYFGLPFPEAVEFIENNEVLSEKITFVSEQGIYYAISSFVPPYEFDITGDASGLWHNYWFASLQEISSEFNYLVRDGYEEYCEELRQAGFTELRYDHYSLFYIVE